MARKRTNRVVTFNPEAPPFDPVGACYLVCNGIAEQDESIADLCANAGMSLSVFYRMMKTNAEIRENVVIARTIRAQRYADEAVRLSRATKQDWDVDDWNRFTANSGLLKRTDIQIKTLLTLAAKYDPELFGDRIIEDRRDGDAPARLIVHQTAEAAEIYRRRVARLTAESATLPEAENDAAPETPTPATQESTNGSK